MNSKLILYTFWIMLLKLLSTIHQCIVFQMQWNNSETAFFFAWHQQSLLNFNPSKQSPTFWLPYPFSWSNQLPTDKIASHNPFFLIEYPVALTNMSHYRSKMAHIELNILRLVLEHQIPMFIGVWEAAKWISDNCCLTCLLKSILKYCERHWKPISNKTDKD